MPFIGLSRPPQQAMSSRIEVGGLAPRSEVLWADERLRVVAFLRHVGCPFAENTVKELRQWAERHPQAAVFVVSHGDAATTNQWIASIGGLGSLRLVVDPQRKLHGEWGIGYSGLSHLATPATLFGALALLPKGIRNRSASGTRWQRAAMFLLAGERIVWAHVPRLAQEFELPPESLTRGVAGLSADEVRT